MNNKILIFGVILLIGLIFISGCLKIQKDIVEPEPRIFEPRNQELKEICEQKNGEWKLFTNGCVDSCGKKPRICTQALTEGCNCGPTKCWNGNECINDIYEPYATPKEACEKTEGVWEKLGERCPIIKEVKIINGQKISECPIQKEDIIGCNCPEEEIFTLQGCQHSSIDLMSIIAYGR